MRFKEMTEMSIEKWDGKAFTAYVTDVDNNSADATHDVPVFITGWNDGKWVTERSGKWKHAYPVEWNQPKKRMTNRQLANWLAQGNGQWKYYSGTVAKTYFAYQDCFDNDPVGSVIVVRTRDSQEWVEPTVDLIT